MACIARLAQMADDVVGMEVDDHACDEKRGSDVKIGFGEPAFVIVGRRDVEDPAALHQGVERIEEHAHSHDTGRHFRIAPDQQRKDERPLQVVSLEQDQQGQRRRFPRAVGEEPENGHGDEYRTLHQHPADPVRDREAVFTVEEIAVSGLEIMECDVNRQGQQGHDDQKNVKICCHAAKVFTYFIKGG